MSLKGKIDRDSINEEVASRLNLPLDEVSKAVDSQFAMVAKTMKSAGFRAARLPFLGQWKVKPNRLKWMQQRQKRQIE